ncbi:MAG: MOSC domain-containing protein [Robiginitomaculum sp.]|nr:MOSC domain-containing protein [Robiginitomaculum sp.]
MRIKSLHIFPVKSARAIDLHKAIVKPRGLAGDRRFLLVDADGSFITQRQIPKLAQLCVKLTPGGIALRWSGQDWVDIPFPMNKTRKQITVWHSTVDAVIVEGDINAALSRWLSRPVSLVFMDDKATRLTNTKWSSPASQVSFADGYPVLITNTASLTALNDYITNTGGVALTMDRFRPNVVVESDRPWDEDNWKSVRIGDVVLDLVKPCARCVVTSIDQTTGKKNPNTALTALKHLHPSADPKNPGVIFGMNAIVRTLGNIRVGNTVKTGALNDITNS